MTMYEKLMMLPIFKGINPEEMSAFLGKTHLEFSTHDVGSIIVPRGEECETLHCVLSGRIQSIYMLWDGKVKLAAEYGPGKVIGLDRLFGLDTHYSHTVKALDECGTMSFSKAQYVTLLNSSHICTINYLNILSYRCQRAENAIGNMAVGLIGKLASVVTVLTDRDCKRILIKGLECNEESEDAEQLKEMIEKRIVSPVSENTLEIFSRQALLDYAESLQK